MRRKLTGTILLAAALLLAGTAAAQHTLGVTAGYGMGSSRLYPKQETRGVWGLYSAGVQWRYYGTQRYVGGFGIDLEFLQRGFSYAPYASSTENEADYQWYTRKVNSILLPIVWQPHIYVARNRLRIFLEASAFFSYNISSTYVNEVARDAGKPDWEGKYTFVTARDNRWGYGLAGGGGFAVLVKQFEISLRVRYYFGYSDIVRNRNKYSGNSGDSPANPFASTPIRSPLDNLNVSIGLSYRFNKEGFNVWKVCRQKAPRNDERFNYKLN